MSRWSEASASLEPSSPELVSGPDSPTRRTIPIDVVGFSHQSWSADPGRQPARRLGRAECTRKRWVVERSAKRRRGFPVALKPQSHPSRPLG